VADETLTGSSPVQWVRGLRESQQLSE
jgi:hypothetical protein